jgi:hypothetical protein
MNIACPICRKCMTDPKVIEPFYDRMVEEQKMPKEYE